MENYLSSFDITGINGEPTKPAMLPGLHPNVTVAYIKGEPSSSTAGNFVINVGIVALDDPSKPDVFNEKDATEFRLYVTEKAMAQTMNKLRHILNVCNPAEAPKFPLYWKKALETGGVDAQGNSQVVIVFCKFLSKLCAGKMACNAKISGELAQDGSRVFSRLAFVPFLEPMSSNLTLKFDPAKDSAEVKKTQNSGPVMPGNGMPSQGIIPNLGNVPSMENLGSVPQISDVAQTDELPF